MKKQGYMGILIHVPNEVHRRFRKEAKRHGKSLQDFGAIILTAYLEVRKKKTPVLRKKGLKYGDPEPYTAHRTIPYGWELPSQNGCAPAVSRRKN